MPDVLMVAGTEFEADVEPELTGLLVGAEGPIVGVSTMTVVAGTVSPLVVTGPVSVVEVVVYVPDHGTVVVVMIPEGGEDCEVGEEGAELAGVLSGGTDELPTEDGLKVGVSTMIVVAGMVSPLVVTGPVSVVEVVV